MNWNNINNYETIILPDIDETDALGILLEYMNPGTSYNQETKEWIVPDDVREQIRSDAKKLKKKKTMRVKPETIEKTIDTLEMKPEVEEVLKNKDDAKLYSIMYDLYNENNSCIALQSFRNWTAVMNSTDAKRIHEVICRIEENEKALEERF